MKRVIAAVGSAPVGRVGRADMLRALAAGATPYIEGWDWSTQEGPTAEQDTSPSAATRQAETRARISTSEPERPPQPVTEVEAEDWSPIPFWHVVEATYFASQPTKNLVVPAVESLPHPSQDYPPPLAVGPESLTAVLDDLGGGFLRTERTRQLDLARSIRKLSQGNFIDPLPYISRSRWPLRLVVWVDIAARLTPFRKEQLAVIEGLRRRCGTPSVLVRVLAEGPEGTVQDESGEVVREGLALRAGDQVLALTDLGKLGAESERTAWARQLRRAGTSGRAGLTLGPEAWSAGQTSDDQGQTLLLGLVAVLTRCEPGLLRGLRRLLGTRASLSDEVAVAARPEVVGHHAAAIWVRYPEVETSQAGLRDWMIGSEAELAAGIVRQAFQLSKQWHAEHADEIVHLETLSFANLPGEEVVTRNEREAAIQYFRALAAYRDTCAKSNQSSGLLALTQRIRVRNAALLRDLSAATDAHGNPLLEIAARCAMQEAQTTLPEGVSAESWAKAQSTAHSLGGRWQVYQAEAGLSLEPGEVAPSQDRNWLCTLPHAGSSISVANAATGVRASYSPRAGQALVEVLPSEVETNRPEPLPTYPWAHEVTEDKYGIRAEVRIEGVSFVLRWIERGTFLMGSPDSEEGRYDDEGPQHEVSLDGYWMAETPVTQALYEAVAGTNPSEFVSETRPVEQVTWEQCAEFCTQLNALIPDLNLRLPTEAEWEYACRAGTQTSTYAGQLEILGERNGPLLDAIAWYGGNSGVGFELKNGHDNSDWAEKQHEDGPAGTHPVTGKAPNPWGLCDTLGNVDEWCSDYWDAYSELPSTNPLGPSEGTERVIRGGSWDYRARFVRAALRLALVPSYANSYLGFRVSRGQAGPEASPKSGAERAARRASESGITLITDRAKARIEVCVKPEWASAIGRDRYGLWTAVEVAPKVQVRLRWIPPGRFTMGSPKSEVGRFGREVQHEVSLTHGYWLGETPVTQAIWHAVTGSNPSNFVSAQRPVENVSWTDSVEMLEQWNGQKPGLNLRLPSEAEWEYACRAGTQTSTYAGNLEILGERNAPLLDGIAWYGGNSGVAFELKNGVDNSDWDEKQHEDGPAGTHPVKGKAPNPWGLYDTLGNVYEWCSDWHSEYSESPSTNPLGPSEGTKRVIRGGSWRNHAQVVRAALRHALVPSYAYSLLGFRVSRGQAGGR